MKDNQFTHWTTQELEDWVGKVTSYSILTINNVNTYIQALKELGYRAIERDISS
ncbi:MAG TPA: hypothetical protein PKK61_01140 [Defluviitaleaceae bacterium]|nr:hypothetical protein [Defluviitaleaceae bacterium]